MVRNPERLSVESESVRYEEVEEAFRRALELAAEIGKQDISHCTAKMVRSCFSRLAPKLRALDSKCEALLQGPVAAQEAESGIYGHLHAISSAVKTAIAARKFKEGELAVTLVNAGVLLHMSSKYGNQEVASARARPKTWDPCCPRCGRSRRPEDWNRLCPECRSQGELARILLDFRTNRAALRDVQGIAEFERLLCRAFKSENVSEGTLKAFEEFLDRVTCRKDETPRGAGERWRGSMALFEAMSLLDAEIARLESEARSQQAFSLGRGRFQIGTTVFRLEGAQANALESLVALRAATKSQLVNQSGVQDAPRVLKQIKATFPLLSPFIMMPGGRGKGGYTTSIRPLDQ